MTEKFTVTFSPHVRGKATTNSIMLDVILALIPALIAAIVIFGPRAALLTGVCILACIVFEYGYQKILNRPITVMDFTAVITGLLLAFNLPVGIPLWQAVFGCFVAIILVKQLFGGLGKNFANPAITARVVMFLAFAQTMTTWEIPQDAFSLMWGMPDAVASPTPLVPLAAGAYANLPSLWDMFIGVRGGSIGETSALALLLGGAYLLMRRVITWHIPVSFIGTVALLSLIAGQSVDFMLFHLMAGGLLIGAIFMATDYVTSPQTSKGRIIFGIGCGLLTVIIRLFGNYPEGVSFAILFMNVLVPFINKVSMTKPLGGKES